MTDEILLSCIEENSVVLNKGNTPSLKLAKNSAWQNILKEHNDNGIETTQKQLYKRWMNIKGRTTEKIRKKNSTGGGPCLQLNTQENTVLKLIGETNPIMNKIPGACSSYVETHQKTDDTGKSDTNDFDDVSSEGDYENTFHIIFIILNY